MRASVIIPTYNRSSHLRRLLESLTRIEDEGLGQVVVCDDGSSDDTREVALGFCDRLPLEYCFQEDKGFRAGKARNMGIQRATCPVLIFVDDDLLLLTGFVRAHIQAHENRGLSVGLGERRRLKKPPPDVAVIQDLLSLAEADDRAEAFAAGLRNEPAPWKLLYSCNVSLRRDHPELYFDERFSGWGQEDTDLGYRMWRADAEFRFVEGAVALHVEDESPRDPFRCEVIQKEPDYRTYLENCVRILDKYPNDPELREGILPDLRWYELDEASGTWKKNGRHNDSLMLVETIRREFGRAARRAGEGTEIESRTVANAPLPTAPHEWALTRGLEEVAIEFTVYCNLSCKMCSVWEGRQHGIPYEVAEETLRQARALGAKTLTPCGAETFTRPDVVDLFELAEGIGFEHINVVTNGLLLNESRLNRLQKLKSLHLNVSIDGPREVHDDLRGEGNFDRAVVVLRELRRRGMSFGISSVLMRQSLHRIEEVLDLASSVGVSNVSLQPYQAEIGYNVDSRAFDLQLWNEDVIRGRLEQIEAHAKRVGIEVFTASLLDLVPAYLARGVRPIPKGGCFVPSRFLLVNYRGDVYPCFFMRKRKIGNVYDRQLTQLWHNEVQRALNELALNESCPGCLAACSDVKTYDLLAGSAKRNGKVWS